MDADDQAGCGPAILSGERRVTHDEVRARADRAAAGLRALGVGEGDTVALLLRNDVAVFEATLAATRAGAYPVPLNWHAAPADTADVLRDCAAKLLVAHEDLLVPVLPVLPPGLPVLVVETPAEVRTAYDLPAPDAAAARAADGVASPRLPLERWSLWLAGYSPIETPSEALRAAVIYTSGTTGRPKGVRRPASRPSPPSRALEVYGLDRPEPVTMLITGPLYHSVPNACGRLAFAAGADLVLQPRFEPEETLALIARHGVTHLHLVPSMMVRLLQLPEAVRRRHDLSALRHVVHGAAPCPVPVKRAMIAWLGPVVHEYYGSTETGLLTFHGSAEALRRPGTVGRPLPGITIEVLGEKGRPQPPGVIGDVYAGSATLHDFTYIGRDAAREAIGRGDLVTAGDVGWRDHDGYLYLIDRKRDAIVSDGRTIFPAEIEAVLLGQPGVADCAVIGAAAADASGETVRAFVVLAPGASVEAEDLARAIESLLEPAKRPRSIDIVESLPREDSGKLFKNRLRASAGTLRPS